MALQNNSTNDSELLSRENGPAFRGDIEGLRAVAISLVVLFHCDAVRFPGGFLGVDVFFVLSGYLISGLLISEHRRAGKIDLVRFYARRARRLVPAAVLVSLATIVLSAIILAPHEMVNAGRAARANSLYLSNVFFAINSSDYFSPEIHSNPFLHTWSLSVEEQFYLFWPILVLGSLTFRRASYFVPSISGVVIASLFLSLVWSDIAAFYHLPTRAWEFAAGGLAAVIPTRWRTVIPPLLWMTLGGAGLLTVVGSGLFIEGGVDFPVWIAAAPVIGTILVLVSGRQVPRRGPAAFLAAPALQAIGRLSYSWYLWHWPAIVLADAAWPGIGPTGKYLAAAVALVIAAGTFRLVEDPLRSHPALVSSWKASISMAAMGSAITFGAAFFLIWFGTSKQAAPGLTRIAAAIADIADMHRESCVTLKDSSAVLECSYGPAHSSTHIVLFGDSHAVQWFNPIRHIVETRGWKLTTFLKSRCPSIKIELPGHFGSSCSNWQSAALTRIAEIRPELVIMANMSGYIEGPGEDGGPTVTISEWRGGMSDSLQALTRDGRPVAIIRDNPRFPFDVPTCLARSVSHRSYSEERCKIAHRAEDYADLFEVERATAGSVPNVHILDFTEAICPNGQCRGSLNGTITYRDNNHLTGSFAGSLAPLLKRQIDDILVRRSLKE